MKKVEYYQCEWCCYVGLKEQVEKHEKGCLAKDFRALAESKRMCCFCRHYYSVKYQKDKLTYLSEGRCFQGRDIAKKGVPAIGKCETFALDIEWIEETEKKLAMNMDAVHSHVPLREPPEVVVDLNKFECLGKKKKNSHLKN